MEVDDGRLVLECWKGDGEKGERMMQNYERRLGFNISFYRLQAFHDTFAASYERSSISASRRVMSPRFEISRPTFNLHPPSSLLKLNERAWTVEYCNEKLLRGEEPSLDPLSRYFRYSLEIPALPHSSLLLLPVMQNQSLVPSTSTPRRHQSVAALLPAEIVDSIFAQFGYDYARDVSHQDLVERKRDLSNMSVVAEGWLNPARRLLATKVSIWSWRHLQEEVGEYLGQQVRDFEICGSGYRMTSLEAADAVFRLLKQLPNLRRLRLVALPLEAFNSVDSASMHAAALLPHLHDLDISHIPFPHSLILDLLATSGHRIDRLSVQSNPVWLAPPVTYRQIDFRGKLRFLSTGADFFRTLVDPRLVAPGGLRGLEALQLQSIGRRSTEGGEEMYHVIGPTLSVLAIESDDVTWVAEFLPLCSNLSRLSITGFSFHRNLDPTPLLRCLPPSLSSIQLGNDTQIGPTLARWIAGPSLVPAGLKQIRVDDIHDFETYQQLPPIPTLCTDYRHNTINNLQRLVPGTVPFQTLEMYFDAEDLPRRSEVQAECQRLGVKYRQRTQRWDA